jgi:hypothetical protein
MVSLALFASRVTLRRKPSPAVTESIVVSVISVTVRMPDVPLAAAVPLAMVSKESVSRSVVMRSKETSQTTSPLVAVLAIQCRRILRPLPRLAASGMMLTKTALSSVASSKSRTAMLLRVSSVA